MESFIEVVSADDLNRCLIPISSIICIEEIPDKHNAHIFIFRGKKRLYGVITLESYREVVERIKAAVE